MNKPEVVTLMAHMDYVNGNSVVMTHSEESYQVTINLRGLPQEVVGYWEYDVMTPLRILTR